MYWFTFFIFIEIASMSVCILLFYNINQSFKCYISNSVDILKSIKCFVEFQFLHLYVNIKCKLGSLDIFSILWVVKYVVFLKKNATQQYIILCANSADTTLNSTFNCRGVCECVSLDNGGPIKTTVNLLQPYLDIKTTQAHTLVLHLNLYQATFVKNQ